MVDEGLSEITYKSSVKRSLGRPRRKCENNIKIDIKHTRYSGVEWIKLTHFTVKWTALVNEIIILRVLESIIKPT